MVSETRGGLTLNPPGVELSTKPSTPTLSRPGSKKARRVGCSGFGPKLEVNRGLGWEEEISRGFE